MLGLYRQNGDSHAIRPTAITSFATDESVFLPLGTGLHPENFEKISVVTSMSVF